MKFEKSFTQSFKHTQRRDYENRKKTMDYHVRIWAVCHLFFRLDF